MNLKRIILNFIHLFRPIYVPICTCIRKVFKSTSVVFCTCKFIRRVSNPIFRNYISQYRNPVEQTTERAPDHPIINLPVHVLGPLNKGKIIMLMKHDASYAGIGAIWVYYLNRLAFSDRMGFHHVFECTKNMYYQEEHPVHGITNVFEYYFQQPSKISLKDAYKSNCVVMDWNNPEYGYNDFWNASGTDNYEFKDRDINEYARLQRKYFHLQPWVEKQLEENIKDLLSDCKTLGVHARGADTKMKYKNHPAIVSVEDYIRAAKKARCAIGAKKIFLATDDEEMLLSFQNAFGTDLLYYKDVIRSKGTVMNCYIEEKRDNHRYNLGLEAIRDVYTLAACQGLVCGISCISFVAQVLKRSKGEKYKVLKRLSNGVNKEGRNMLSEKDRQAVRNEWSKELGRETDERSFARRQKVFDKNSMR